MTAEIEVSRDGDIQVLRISRPEKKNALTAAMYRALSDAIEAGDADDKVAAHVFFGKDGLFTAGNDLGDFLATAKGTGAVSNDVLRFIRLLPAVEKPMIAAVDGAAIGIGTTMLLHCDLVYATPRATFSTPFLDLGLIPEAASSLLMPRRMGYARAFEMLALGDVYTAEQALAAGLLNRVVPSADVELQALTSARRLAAKPPQALKLARRLMRGDQQEVLARTDEEIRGFSERLRSPEVAEALTAFFAKRPPNFRAAR